MDKLKMMSMDKVQKNIDKIRQLFPNAVTEVLRDGKPALAVDFDVLKQELADTLIDDRELRYQFTWPDKQKAILRANERTNKTLRPCEEESVDFDTTQNLYIEGDNLEVLKLLQETYLGKIKMIYIDPPYNTGNDFVYNDNFTQSMDKYLENSGQIDEQGNRLFLNTESNGRFHTDWLNMIYPRLRLAKDLLSDDGLIFISIDDNEANNLRKICDEIFGGANFVAQFVWQKKSSGGQHANFVLDFHEYILCYSKDIFSIKGLLVDRTNSQLDSFVLKDEYFESRGYYLLSPLKSWLDYRPTLIYDIECPDGTVINTQWICAKSTFEQLKSEGRILFKQSTKGNWSVYKKQYSNENGGKVKPASLITEHGQTAMGKRELKDLFNADVMSFPKPIELIKYLISSNDNANDIILDFFSGSSTTAHAVMQLNAEDGGNRKFIMVQLPELCDEKSEAYKAGYKNICEIGKERIRRAGKKIMAESGLTAQNLDIGFRVFKLDSSNMQDVYYKPEEYSQTLLDNLQDNIKPDRTALDLLFQVMLELGKPLSAKITQKVIAGKNVFNVDDGDLIACFDDNITAEIVTEIAKAKPLYAVFRDSGLSSDSVAANFEQIFATYSPATTRKVL